MTGPDWHRHEEYRDLGEPDDEAEYWGEEGPAGATAEELASGLNPATIDAYEMEREALTNGLVGEGYRLTRAAAFAWVSAELRAWAAERRAQPIDEDDLPF